MTISTPRPVSAEGPLLGTVRCLLGTLLAGQCRQAEAPAPAPSPAPAPAPSSPSRTPSQPSSSPSNSESTAQPAQASPGNSGQSSTQRQSAPIAVEEVAMPPQVTADIPEARTVPESSSSYTRMSGAEYLAYFNTYSPYAVAGAEQQAAATAPIARTDEGWKIFGVAWYWWGIGLIGAAAIATSVYRKRFAKITI